SYEPTQSKLLTREIRLERDQPQTLSLQLDLTAVHVDARVESGCVSIHCLIVQCSGRLELCASGVDSRHRRDNLQIRSADTENHEIPTVANIQLGGKCGFLVRTIISNSRQVEQALTENRTGVEEVEWAEYPAESEVGNSFHAL